MENDLEIIFKEEEMKYLNSNHDDALIVFVRMINAQVKMVLIDIDSFTNILYFDAFQKLWLFYNDLTPTTSSLMGFISHIWI